MKEIEELFQEAIISQAFEAEYNLFIYKSVSDEFMFLKEQNADINSMFAFIQNSSQYHVILALSKLYDTNKKYQTKCFDLFWKKVKLNVDSFDAISNKAILIRILKNYECPDELTKAVNSVNSSTFYNLFHDYYISKVTSNQFKEDLKTLKNFRDKAIAHNETNDVEITHDALIRLLDFAKEVIEIFGMAFNSTYWRNDDVSFITRDAERNAYFIKNIIQKMKTNIFV